jgi:hypothetical protein
MALDDTSTCTDRATSNFIDDCDDTSICAKTAPYSFALTTTKNQHTPKGEVTTDEDEEISKLIYLFSIQRPFLHKTPEPLSKKALHELTTELPPPAVYRRKKKSGLCGSTIV